MILQLPLTATVDPALPSFGETLVSFAPGLLAWGWLLVVLLGGWFAWGIYKLQKTIDYFVAIKWVFLQIRIPEESEFTPKSMENAIAVWAGIHKNPDVLEKFFEGYLEAWYSLEVQCEQNRARYIMVVPEVHKQFFEGVIYGQFPTAEIQEVEDYTQAFDFTRVRQDFDVYGTNMILVKDDVYPIRTYNQYEDPLAPADTFVDPHQAMIEAYTNVRPGEQFWFQVLVWPKGVDETEKFVKRGEAEVARITGRSKEPGAGILRQLRNFFLGIPSELIRAATSGPVVSGGGDPGSGDIHFFDPIETSKMEGILQKTSREVYPTLVRVIHIAPKGQLHKPNIGRAIGGFKQFNTFHLNSFKPDPNTKSNAADYIMKERRRRFRERQILAYYQWRDPTGAQMMTAEEIATLYHLPSRWVQSPLVERTKAGLQAAPDNLPYL